MSMRENLYTNHWPYLFLAQVRPMALMNGLWAIMI